MAALTAVHVERWWPAACCGRPAAATAGASNRSTSRAPALLGELVDELGFDDESVETVVDLVDQVHTLRRQLDLLGRAIAEQPAATREAIGVALDRLSAALERFIS